MASAKAYRRPARRILMEPLENQLLLAGHPVITEFMASNGATLDDGDGNSSDWIEVFNAGDDAVDLAGYRLTDKQDNLSRWVFPQAVLPPKDYLVVFASSQDVDNYVDAAGNLHTSFALNADGEYLALVAPDGSVVSQYDSAGEDYPPQLRDVSFGIGVPAGNEVGPPIGYMATPTPGGPNVSNEEILVGFVEETQFSVDRGFYETPQTVAISTATPEASIYVTTDGSRPDPASPSARLYTAPMTIDSTTILRAAAFREGFLPTRVNTHTYVFPHDVLTQDIQSTLNAGFPPLWGNAEPDYGMDQRVIEKVGTEAMLASLTSIPTMSIVVNIEDLFAPDGIYTLSEQSGRAMERAASVEWIRPDRVVGFQIGAGMRIQGGESRSHDFSKKHSFRLLFKSEYGPGKLEYPLFEDADAVQEFDTLILRAGAHDSWNIARYAYRAQYARDEFHRRTQLAMGQPSAHGTHAHLYINGVYWGLYNIVERPDESFAAAYFGMEQDDWDGFSNRLDSLGVTNVSHMPQPGGGPFIFDDPARVDRAVTAWQTLADMAQNVPQFLFTWDGLLDESRIVPTDLREAFEVNGRTLSPRASVSVLEVGTNNYPVRWRINDATADYLVEWRDRGLARVHVYSQSESARFEADAAYQALLGNRPDGSNDPNLRTWLDVDNYIDYIILSHYGANRDWPKNNFYVGAENSHDSTGFKFFIWDAEISMMVHTPSVYDHNFDISRFWGGVQDVFFDLRQSQEFRTLFADHVHRHYFNGGALYVDPRHPQWDPDNPERNVPAARYVEVADELDKALLAESARWGDQHRPNSAYTRDRQWVAQRDNLLQNWFPQRSQIMVDAYRQMGLYSEVDAPAYNQHGGAVPRDFKLSIENPGGRGIVYYTLDGSDPRVIGGDVSAAALVFDGNAVPLSSSAQVKSRVWIDGEWSALNETTFAVVEVDPPTYRAGDANRDYRFDRLDVVQVLQAAKYNTGRPADWTEGDWNGDRRFDRLDIVSSLQTGNYLQGPYAARAADEVFAAFGR